MSCRLRGEVESNRETIALTAFAGSAAELTPHSESVSQGARIPPASLSELPCIPTEPPATCTPTRARPTPHSPTRSPRARVGQAYPQSRPQPPTDTPVRPHVAPRTPRLLSIRSHWSCSVTHNQPPASASDRTCPGTGVPIGCAPTLTMPPFCCPVTHNPTPAYIERRTNLRTAGTAHAGFRTHLDHDALLLPNDPLHRWVGVRHC